MYKKIILFIFLFLIYYFFIFILSFINIAKSISNNDEYLLKKYIYKEDIKNHFFNDIYQYSTNSIKIIDKKLNIKNDSIEFTGEVTEVFLKKIFNNLSENISNDFSESKILLYFYFNSNNLEEYLSQSLIHLGNYNFDQYLLFKEKNKNNNIDTKNESQNNDQNNNQISNTISNQEKKDENYLSKLIRKYKSTEYFFLSSPIHFKISTLHQDISFVVFLKFNGYYWKIQSITLPYNELIKTKNINFDYENNS